MNSNSYDLDRFIKAQETEYEVALKEIKSGYKIGHWIWYIFPQIQGLGSSKLSKYYAIKDKQEAKIYLKNDLLRNRLIEICNELLNSKNSNIVEIMGYPDNLKLCSSMTLFSLAEPEYKVFKNVLDKFYKGRMDDLTIEILEKNGD